MKIIGLNARSLSEQIRLLFGLQASKQDVATAINTNNIGSQSVASATTWLGKPSWIGSTKPSYSASEISGLGTAAAKSTGYIDESIPVIGETLVAGQYAYIRNDMQLGSKALPKVTDGVEGLMPYSAYTKLQGIEIGTIFSGFDNTEVNGEDLAFNLKSVQLPADIDVTNLFNGSNVTGLTIDVNFFSFHRFVVRRTYGSKTMTIPVQMTVEDSDYRLTFYYVKGGGFSQGKLTYVYASFTLGANSLVYDSKGTFDIQ